MKKLLVSLLLSLLIFPSDKKSFTLLIPGMEQFKEKKYAKATVLAGSFLGFTIAAILKNQDGYKYYDRYRAATDPDSAVYYRKKTEQSFRDRNFFILGAIGVWLIHIIDLEVSRKKKARIGGGIEKGNLYICFAYRF